jgi:putative transposase
MGNYIRIARIALQKGSVAKLVKVSDNLSIFRNCNDPMINFKGAYYPKDLIFYAVFFYVRYAVSYRDLEEIMEETGVKVDHATLNRWVIHYSPALALTAKNRKRAVAASWRMDETYIKVKGE